MGKIRVHQLSSELGIPNKELIKKLQSLGFSVKTHSSSVDEDDARRALSGETKTEKKEAKPKRVRTVIRRRSRDESPEEVEDEAALAQADAEVEDQEAEPVEMVAEEQAPEPPVEPPVEEVETPEVAAAEPEAPVAEVEVAGEPEPEPEPQPEVPAEVVEAVAQEPQEPQVVTPEVAPVEPPAEPEAPVQAAEAEPAVEKPEQPKEAKVQAVEAVEQKPAKRGGKKSKAKEPPPLRPPRRAPAQVSKVVRVIDADAIKARLAADGKDFAPRQPRQNNGPFPQVRELQVVQDQFGRGPTMVDVTKDRGGRKGRKSTTDTTSITRRDMREMRAGARDMWRTPGKKRKATKKGAKTEITQMAAHKRIIEIQGTISVGDLAKQMAIKAGEVLRKLMSMGMMVTINQTIDFDTAAIIAAEFEYEIKNVAFEEDDLLEKRAEDKPEDLQHRPSVVTIMGHVDHGKTSLLDAIRESQVTAGEAGGITQHIGAYSVQLGDGIITFLDTPGHEAFTAMRARGAQVTDIVVLVVAADDGVMPQTVEAINHSKSAGVPIVVAVNKCDKVDANPDRVMQALTEYELVSEKWGGETIFVEVSAKEGTGIPDLLESIVLQAEMLDLKANREKSARGTIIEAQLDKGRGPVATVLVQDGTLIAGESVVSGDFFGRVRAMYNDRGEQVEEAGPSMPVQVLGLSGVPNAGDGFDAVADEKAAKLIAEHRAQKTREHELAASSKVSLENWLERAKEDELLELNLIVKADVQGSVEAVTHALTKLSNKQVKVIIVHSAVGAVSESDVNLAVTSEAVIIGFNVRPDTKALQLSEQQKVDIRLYSIIYEALDGVRAAMEGKLPTTTIEKYLGRAEVRQTFNVPKVGTVAGCAVLDGKILRNARIRLLRDNVVIHDGKFASLKRFKDDVREVAQGYECGAGVEGYNDLKPGDIIEAYELTEVATKLEAPASPRGSREEQSHAGA